MANLERIKRDVADIAGRRKAVRFTEIQRVVNQLRLLGWSVRDYEGKEAWVFYVAGEKFSVCQHNRGSSHIKPKYVDNFIGAMINLGLYDEE
jgi:hypothetical protein